MAASCEQTILVVKPDGIEKGLTPEIKQRVLSRGLRIIKKVVVRLSPEDMAILYPEHVGKDFFADLTKGLTSRPVVVFFITGEGAIQKVRDIIGKRYPPSGLRAEFAESIVRNVAHAPDSVSEAEREIKLILSKGDVMSYPSKVFLLGGMSECGKSTLGKYMDSCGVIRLKIVDFLKKVHQKEGGTGDFYKWNDLQEAERPDWLAERFAEEFLSEMEQQQIACCCLESLYKPEFSLALKRLIGERVVVIVYVDIPLETRLQRQMFREGLSSLEEAKRLLLPRDEKKREWGTDRVKDIADEVIDNSGSVHDLEHIADGLLAKHCPQA